MGACDLGDRPPFLLGAMVGADPFAWHDLQPSAQLATISDVVGDLARRGFGAVWVTGFDGHNADLPLIPVWLEAAERHCLRVVVEGSGGPFAIHKTSNANAAATLAHARAEVIPTWRGIARQWGRHPNLLAYCPVEEIGDNVEAGESPTLSALAEVGRAVAEEDPVHPVTTIHVASWVSVAAAEARMRGPNLKALVADVYPFMASSDWTATASDPRLSWRTPDEQTRGYLTWMGRHADIARAAGVPFWVFAQAFSGTWYRRIAEKVESRPLFVMPDLARMRFQIWAAALLGARGVFLFVYQSTGPFPEDVLSTLEEWEYDVGMRTTGGQATEALQGATLVARRMAPLLPLLGRVQVEGAIVEDGPVLARGATDPVSQRRYVLLLNRDVEAEHAVPPALVARFGLAARGTLAPGDGDLVELPAAGR